MMFSDNYTVHERYSLVSGERLADYSEMPWLYTPLVDEGYKPTNIPTGVKNSINRVFEYDYLFQETEAIKEEEKSLAIYHNGDAIESYKSIFKYRYSTVAFQINDYLNKVGATQCKHLFDRAHAFIPKNGRGYASYIGAEHSIDGSITGITIQSKDYDLSSYENPLLDKLRAYSAYHHKFCNGILTVRNNNQVSFYSSFVYPKKMSILTTEKKNPKLDELLALDNFKVISGRQGVSRHLYGYRKHEMITNDQVDAILELVPDMTKDARIQLEHVFEGPELVDLIAHVVKYNEFEEIEIPRTWIIRNDEDGNRIW